jgi:hypothetical protein
MQDCRGPWLNASLTRLEAGDPIVRSAKLQAGQSIEEGDGL